ncbi:MAG: hypothetical protein JRH18_07770 [Deltaproteobacteria bacterium]|nr:hypothetical protein [Deltaproteobacteria bacterium]MBW1960985.1 hypothetical protein [Deltaproteobacteria bacterium]MBW2151548.1 hypothetical protein [Deltaproteobacteria bacterium]
MEDTEFYTATMASVYERQGHLSKAQEIYRYLLEREPERKDIQDALSRIEHALSSEKNRTDEELIFLFDKLVKLIFQYDRLKRLKKLMKGK